MATAIPNPAFISISGRIGNFVFYRRKKTQCVRTYVVPGNPNTPSQRNIRTSFADAVKSWQSLSSDEQYKYTRKARGLNMSGYNLYISAHMKKNIASHSKQTAKSSFNSSPDPGSLHRRILFVSLSILSRLNTFTPATDLHYCRGST